VKPIFLFGDEELQHNVLFFFGVKPLEPFFFLEKKKGYMGSDFYPLLSF